MYAQTREVKPILYVLVIHHLGSVSGDDENILGSLTPIDTRLQRLDSVPRIFGAHLFAAIA